ncbi:MAG: rhodanese-like domain-containing protein [Planctomycetota bacterium]
MALWSQLFGGGHKHTEDTPEEIREAIASGKAVMLDVRSVEEYEAGHLKDVIFVPITDLKALPDGTKNLGQLDPAKIVYCH